MKFHPTLANGATKLMKMNTFNPNLLRSDMFGAASFTVYPAHLFTPEMKKTTNAKDNATSDKLLTQKNIFNSYSAHHIVKSQQISKLVNCFVMVLFSTRALCEWYITGSISFMFASRNCRCVVELVSSFG